MTYSSTLCEAGHRRGPASESICVMCRKRFDRRRKLPILMMIRRANGVVREGAARERNDKRQAADLATMRENGCELLRWNDLELGISAVDRLFVWSPPAELRHMTEAASLHVLVSDFYN
jgi:hypothetical protein